jgi:predicted negative regulator of RcsB-dependent stress response
MAAMLSGRAQAEAGDLKNAKVQLQWAAENAKDDALRDLARLRLAVLLVEEKNYDDAVKQLTAEPSSASFAARFNDLRGDVLALQGKSAEAKAAYEAAINNLTAKADDAASKTRRDPYKEMVQSKLEAAGSIGAGK